MVWIYSSKEKKKHYYIFISSLFLHHPRPQFGEENENEEPKRGE